MTARAWVLGGGVAGIVAAFRLVDRGYSVELVEARSRLGGRVFSIERPGADVPLDNGPHVIMGCYDEFRRLLRRLGTESGFVRPRALRVGYLAPGGAETQLALPPLPVPVAMPWVLARWPALGAARFRAVRGAIAAVRGAPASWSVEDWLVARRQLGAPREWLWDPLCLAIMNAEPAETSAQVFLHTLRRAFGGRPGRAAIWIPQRPWGALVGDPALAALRAAGVRVRLRCRAEAVEVASGRARRLCLQGRVSVDLAAPDLVVSALPWAQAARLLPAHLPNARTLEGRSIVNLTFAAAGGDWCRTSEPLTALVGGRPFQFVYRTPGGSPNRGTLIAGAAAALDGLPAREIADRGRAQLAAYGLARGLCDETAFTVSKEAAATVRVAADHRDWRPRPGSVPGLDNVRLCGDWTQTELPSTLEGAAASAAQMMRDRL
ncbi:MAG: FAD-dependent oxidoreductase [Planctomycetota bacterium]